MMVCSISVTFAEIPFQKPQWQIREFHAPDLLAFNVVRDIKQAPDGSIWFATWGGGVTRLRSGTTQNFTIGDGLLSNDTRKLEIDRFNGVWIATTEGINYIHPNGSVLRYSPSTTPIIQENSFFSIAIDSNDNVWFGSGFSRLYTCEPVFEDGLLSYENWRQVNLPIENNQGGIREIVIDNDHNMWLGIDRYGVILIEPSGAITTIPISSSPQYLTDIYLHPTEGVYTVSNQIYHVTKRSATPISTNLNTIFTSVAMEGNTLITGTRNGIYAIHESDGHLIPMGEFFPTPHVECISVMADGSIWIGTRTGVFRVFRAVWQLLKTVPSGAAVYTLLKGSDGEIFLLGMDRTFYRNMNQQWEYVTTLSAPDSNAASPQPLPPPRFSQENNGYVHVLHGKTFDQENFISTIQTIPFIQLYHYPRYNNTNPYSLKNIKLYLSKQNELWFLHSNGASKWNGESWIDHPRTIERSPENRSVNSILETKEGELWFGGDTWVEVWSRGYGLNLELPDSYKNNQSPIKDIIEHDGKIWLATDSNGILVYHAGKWDHLHHQDGLPSEGCLSLYSASDGALWVGSKTAGIASYRDGRWVQYSGRDGIPNGQINKIAEDRKGTIYINIQYVGIASFHPERQPPTVRIEKASEKLLPNERGVFSFSSHDPYFETPDDELVYSWRIINETNQTVARDWTTYGVSDSILTDRMKPGRYRFEVLAQDKSRNTSLVPAVHRFIVIPYFWSTPQFYGPVILLIIVTMITLLNWIRNYRALRRSEEKYRNLLDKDTITLVLNWDLDGNLLYCNENAEQLIHSIDPAYSKVSVYRWIANEDSEQRILFNKTIQNAQDHPESQQHCRLKLHYNNRDMWISWFFRATKSKGQVEIHAVGVDISRQVNAETELMLNKMSFRDFCDSAYIGIIRIDEQNRIVYMNPAMRQIIQCEKNSHGIPSFQEWADEPEWKEFVESIRKCDTSMSRSMKGTRLQSKTTFYAMVSAIQIQNYIDMMVLDYTEQKQLQRKIAITSQYEQVKLGHELHDGLGQQLSALVLMGKRLKNRVNEYPGLAEIITELNHQLHAALEQSRLVSKGLSPISVTQIGLHEALNDLFDSYRKVYHPKISLVYKEDFYLTSELEANLAYRIVREAVFNALKHAQAGRIDVYCQINNTQREIIVLDDGVGFDHSDSAPFTNGMGCQIMTYHAERIGASLRWDSLPNGGTRLYCLLKQTV